MVKTGFNDPIAPKEGKKIKSPWNFNQPYYDERTSCYVNAGSHYGIGHKQPVGRSGNPKVEVPTLPKGRVNTLEMDYVPRRNLDIEIRD